MKCFQCKKEKAEVEVVNTYNGWGASMCVNCANFYTAFQCNYLLMALNKMVTITTRNGYPYAERVSLLST